MNEIIGYIISHKFIDKIPRKNGSIILILITSLIAISFDFVNVPENCDGCP